MSDLISRKTVMKYLQEQQANVIIEKAKHGFVSEEVCDGMQAAVDAFINFIVQLPTIEAVPLSEIYRCIAGHSNYHGDSVLSAMTCITEGKEVKPIKPIEAVPVVHGEWIKEENTWICSVCRKENACAYDETLCRFTDLFCPKCGAKMKGGTE